MVTFQDVEDALDNASSPFRSVGALSGSQIAGRYRRDIGHDRARQLILNFLTALPADATINEVLEAMG